MATATKTPKRSEADTPLCVEVLEATPNPMFTEEQRYWVRFLRYNRPVTCAACGKKLKVMWTMLCEFRAVDFEHSFVVTKDFPQTFAPLTPVCADHPVGPASSAKGGA